MSIYGKSDPMPEHIIQNNLFEHTLRKRIKVNIPNLGYQNQLIDNKKSHVSRDHVIVADTAKLCLILTLIQQRKHLILLTMYLKN